MIENTNDDNESTIEISRSRHDQVIKKIKLKVRSNSLDIENIGKTLEVTLPVFDDNKHLPIIENAQGKTDVNSLYIVYTIKC